MRVSSNLICYIIGLYIFINILATRSYKLTEFYGFGKTFVSQCFEIDQKVSSFKRIVSFTHNPMRFLSKKKIFLFHVVCLLKLVHINIV